MIFQIDQETTIDTDLLEPAERHILQKLLCWELVCQSLEEFREKTRDALRVGWNNSGPVTPSPPLKRIIAHLESRVHKRLD